MGQTPPMVNIALGAIDKALAELQATGRMADAQKGALSRATVEKVEQVEELNARSRKYNFPAPEVRNARAILPAGPGEFAPTAYVDGR